MNKNMNKSLRSIFGFVLAMTAGAAQATLTQWLSQNAVAAAAPNEFQITVGTGSSAQTLFVRAYSSSAVSGTKFSSAATVTDHDTTGFGVSAGTGDHTAIDNVSPYDVLVFEMPTSNFSLDELKLGFIEGDSDVSVFWGGNGLGQSYDFTKACFSGCSNTSTSGYNMTGTGGLGFQQVNIDDAALNTNIATSSAFDAPGRYLVVSGSLTDSTPDDKFKVNVVTGHKVPVPGTLALLGLALVGMGALKRRNAA